MSSSMSDAPRDGSVIEVFAAGKWVKARWSEQAQGDSISSYGEVAWAAVEGDRKLEQPLYWRPIDIVEYGDATSLAGHRARQPIIVLGLGLGDESKGATVDSLSQEIHDAIAVVRWSGGANAAHNVHHGDRHHTFRQFGAGTLLGLPTLLTDKFLLNLPLLTAEAVELAEKGVHNPLSLIYAHGDVLLTTPIHVALNRAREVLRGTAVHGSCGLGIGETIAHRYAEEQGYTTVDSVGNFTVPGPTSNGVGVLRLRDLKSPVMPRRELKERVIRALEAQARYAAPLIEEAVKQEAALGSLHVDETLRYAPLDELAEDMLATVESITVLEADSFKAFLLQLMERGTVIFEGSQGVLLDEKWGFHPHTTWSQTEPSSVVRMLEQLQHRPYVLGVTRSFSTRHGEGPLPSLNAYDLDEVKLPKDDNSWGRWQGSIVNAPLDLPLLGYSAAVLRKHGVELSGIAVSHLDAFEELYPVVLSYKGELNPAADWSFTLLGDEPFTIANTEDFYRESFEGETGELTWVSAGRLLGELIVCFGAPIVLTASGPQRHDRKFLRAAIAGGESHLPL